MKNRVQFYNGDKKVIEFFENLGYNWMHFIKVSGAISEPEFYLKIGEGTPLFFGDMIMEERKVLDKMTIEERAKSWEEHKKNKGVLNNLIELKYGDYIVYNEKLKQFEKE
jgi:hypothetical protein